MKHIIKDTALAPSGRAKIAWVKERMPILAEIEKRFIAERPLEGVRVSLSVHLEAKTARLALLMKDGGAQMSVTGCNPLSTQDDVAAALAEHMDVYGIHGASDAEYENHLINALSIRPNIVIDDGGDLLSLLHEGHMELAGDVWGGCEETTTGVMRLYARLRDGKLNFPMITVNDAECKHLFDNRYGTGQSVWDGILRTTNLTVAGSCVVVAGYGWCGKGVSMRAKGLGARVIVTEVNPVRAIEAVMDGFDVMPMDEAAAFGDFFITVTGCRDVITREHFLKMKEGTVMCNAGHFDVEVSKPDLDALSGGAVRVKPNIDAYKLENGKTVYLLAEGRLVNLAAGDGHPAEIMDMSFAIQALSAEYIVKNRPKTGVYPVPPDIDRMVALLKLRSIGRGIDALTPEQERYIGGWEA